MPLLVTVTNRDPETPENASFAMSTPNNNSTVPAPPESTVHDRSQLTTSSRFAELKGMCSRLLSLATAEDRNSPSPDTSDDDGDEPQALITLNSSPNKTPVHRNRYSTSTASLSQPVAERDSGPFPRSQQSTMPTTAVVPICSSDPSRIVSVCVLNIIIYTPMCLLVNNIKRALLSIFRLILTVLRKLLNSGSFTIAAALHGACW